MARNTLAGLLTVSMLALSACGEDAAKNDNTDMGGVVEQPREGFGTAYDEAPAATQQESAPAAAPAAPVPEAPAAPVDGRSGGVTPQSGDAPITNDDFNALINEALKKVEESGMDDYVGKDELESQQ